jgi:hypothetical protein
MLTCFPFKEEVLEAAKANGWEWRIQRGRLVFTKPNHLDLIVQNISDESWYSHTVASGIARHFGIEIETPAHPMPWTPTEPERS